MNEPVIRIEGLVRRYGELAAVDGLSFEVAPGETFGLIGPDGAGKTTTIRTLLGLVAPTSGTVRTLGLEPVRQRRALSRRVGYLAQRFSLYGDLSVDENIAFFALVHGVRRWRPRRDELLERLRLSPFRDRLAERLSGGMKQKLALACTLIHTPELLVLDEPTTGVDPVSRREFWRILGNLQREGMTLLVTTPYLDEAERCRRVALVDRGKLLALDTPEALRRLARGAVVEVLAHPRREARAALLEAFPAAEVETFGERLHVTFPGTAAAEGAAAALRTAEVLRARGFEVETARPTAPTLEDVFIARLHEVAP